MVEHFGRCVHKIPRQDTSDLISNTVNCILNNPNKYLKHLEVSVPERPHPNFNHLLDNFMIQNAKQMRTLFAGTIREHLFKLFRDLKIVI